MARHVRILSLLVGVGLAGCGGGGSMGDAGPTPTAAETSACSHLFSIDPSGGCATGSMSGCTSTLANVRARYASSSCMAEYTAFVACLQGLAMCDSGQQCPTEWTAFSGCSGATF